jgi:hypothetical protein
VASPKKPTPKASRTDEAKPSAKRPSAKKARATEEVREVECIARVRVTEHGTTEFLIKWNGLDASENSWEPEENLLDDGVRSSPRPSREPVPPRRRAHRTRSPAPRPCARARACEQLYDEFMMATLAKLHPTGGKYAVGDLVDVLGKEDGFEYSWAPAKV